MVEAGWRLGGWHVGIRVDAVTGLDVVGHRQDVAQAFASERLDATVVELEAGWTAWVTFPHEPAAAEIRAVGTGLRKVQSCLRPDVSSPMGVGRTHAGVAGLATTVSEAADAARLAATRPETGHFLHVDQLGVAQLLLEWTRTDTFQPAARSLLAPLLNQSGDLVTTLTAYLDAESSVAETAAVLGVHRNTVAARIRRVEELLDVDLTHRDDRLALHLACRTLTLSADLAS